MLAVLVVQLWGSSTTSYQTRNWQTQDIGGNDIQKQEMREAVELPLTHFELYRQIGIDPPRGVLLWGPPGTGKTMLAKAVAHHTTAAFIRVVGSEFVQKYLGEVRAQRLHGRLVVSCPGLQAHVPGWSALKHGEPDLHTTVGRYQCTWLCNWPPSILLRDTGLAMDRAEMRIFGTPYEAGLCGGHNAARSSTSHAAWMSWGPNALAALPLRFGIAGSLVAGPFVDDVLNACNVG